MGNQLAIIEKKLTSEEVTNQLALTLNLDLNDEKAVAETRKYVNSVLAEVKRSEGRTGDYTDLTKATPDSIVMAMIDAANHRLQIDGRKLCYLEKRGNKVGLQITTNGFAAKIKERYPDFVFTQTPVFKGDKPPVITEKDGNKSYEFTSQNPFGTPEDLSGILISISYTNAGGRLVQDVQAVPIADLKKMQSQSKSAAWGSYTIERMKTAAFKRACKWHFRQDATIEKIINYDNSHNFDVNQPASPTKSSIIDNINRVVQPEPAQEPDIIDVEIADEPEDLKLAGDEAASKGVESYTAWLGTLTDEQKAPLKQYHKQWTETAKEADSEEAISWE